MFFSFGEGSALHAKVSQLFYLMQGFLRSVLPPAWCFFFFFHAKQARNKA